MYVLTEGDTDIGYKIRLKGSSEEIVGVDSENYTAGGAIGFQLDLEEEAVFEVIGYCKNSTCTSKAKNIIVSFAWIQSEDEINYGNNGHAVSLSMEGNAPSNAVVSDSNGTIVINKDKPNGNVVSGIGYTTAGNEITITSNIKDFVTISSVSVQTSLGELVATSCNDSMTSCTFEMPQNNVVIEISYNCEYYNITSETDSRSAIKTLNSSGESISNTFPGDIITVQYTAEKYYQLGTFQIVLGDTIICSSWCETFEMPEGDVTIKATSQEEPYLASKIMLDNNAVSDDSIDFASISSDDNGKGLYYTTSNTEDGNPTYYFRGAVTNNYVQFGAYTKDFVIYRGYSETDTSMASRDYVSLEQCQNAPDYNLNCEEVVRSAQGTSIYWRIIRINEDGSIRLIYQGETSTAKYANATIGVSFFNTTAGDNTYVGYMYGSASASNLYNTHMNVNSSTIKEAIDSWYSSYFSNYGSYLVDAGFCGDRGVAPYAGAWGESDTALGYGTNITLYASYQRLSRNKAPQFKCDNKDRDLYTLKTSSQGNMSLDYPIGLISADEVAYAGSVLYTANSTYYLNAGASMWTMSPISFYDGVSNVVDIVGVGTSSFNSVTDVYGVRPVINLKANVTVSSGDGTSSTPYIIATN